MTRPLVAAALVVIGLAFLGGAGYVWIENDLAHYGQATYAIAPPEGTELEPQTTVPEDARVVTYGELPPAAQAAFEARLAGESRILWGTDDRRAVDALSPYSGGYVRYQGRHYEFILLAGHRGSTYWQTGLLKFLGALGVGLALVGVSLRERYSLRTSA